MHIKKDEQVIHQNRNSGCDRIMKFGVIFFLFYIIYHVVILLL